MHKITKLTINLSIVFSYKFRINLVGKFSFEILSLKIFKVGEQAVWGLRWFQILIENGKKENKWALILEYGIL